MVNLNPTLHAHDDAHNVQASVNHGITQSQNNMGALSMSMAADRAIVNRENNDGGKLGPSVGGQAGMVAKTIDKIGTAVAGVGALAIGGPAGVAIGTAALAIDVAKFAMGGKSAEPTGGGTYFKPSSDKMTRGGVYKKAEYDPIVAEGYSDSQGGFTASGGSYNAAPTPQQLAAKAPPAFMQRMVDQADAGEEAQARKRLGKSEDQYAANQRQLDGTIGYAQTRDLKLNGINKGVADGPPPPSGVMGGIAPRGFA